MSISNFEPPAPQVGIKQRRGKRYCLSCGALESNIKPIQPTTSAPVVQYGQETRVDLCRDCFIAQGLLDHLEYIKACMASAQQEHEVLLQARELCLTMVTPKQKIKITPETQKTSETEDNSQTPERDTNSPPPDDKNSDGSNDSWTAIDKPDMSMEADSATAAQSPGSSAWIHISPTSKSTAALLKALGENRHFASYTRVSPFLQNLSEDLLQGRIGVPDFFEQLDDVVGKGDSHSLTALKRQAFRVAGDMGTAMKMLVDHALPKHETEEHGNTQTLACLLEFFLDLCEGGEISSVGFFWPQICHIHLCMLPPENAFAVSRVDLMEDFLLTVATKYSVQLALELVWSHTADLEESLSTAPCSGACRSRRFAVLRFVCELESVMFGHEDGWGGGSVTLGKMLSATGDQLLLLKRTVTQIQEYRRTSICQLNHSVRRDVLLDRSQPPEVLAEEKLRIAKNADYFTCHLSFTKRLCDIAEKLRFMDVRKRADALEEELNLLNSSGTMGGDPFNQVHDSFIRVVRVPSTEGHVFRSKERTPVLLLVEQVDEGAEADPSDEESVKQSADAFGKKDKERDQTKEDLKEFSLDDESPEGNRVRADSERSQVQFSDVPVDSEDLDAPETPSRSGPPLSVVVDELEGASEHKSTTALRRFDGSETSSVEPTTPKEVVEKMVTNVMVEQIQEDLGIPPLNIDATEDQDAKASEIDGPEIGQSTDPTSPKGTSDSFATDAPKSSVARRMFKNSICELNDQPNDLAPTGDIRREVLNVIMMRGRQEKNSIAAGTADSAQRSLKELETKRATALLLGGEQDTEESEVDGETSFEQLKSTNDKLASLGLGSSRSADLEDLPQIHSEEDEIMEAVRLLLIQNRVAQGHLSAADASKVLQHISLSRVNSSDNLSEKGSSSHPGDMPTVDAGDLDPRLAGCGPLPPAVLQALTLWKGEMVTNGELLELVKKDIAFVRHSVLLEAENVDKLKEDSAFWGRFAFGERWAEKKSRIAALSPQGTHPGWDLVGIIVKSNDDLRQEAFIMQLIELCQEAFDIAKLELWVSPYRILATGRTTGIIEMVRNAMSFDALKKRPGYGKGGLREHLHRMTEFTADPGGSFKSAQMNFVRSLAAYSLMSYFFLFKDRHNGNLLLDTAGHVIHIDFGFVFGSAPGGSFSLEMSTPFKLTEEMLEVMGGLRSPIFSEFVTLFCCGFLALQSYSETFFTLVEITSRNSTFKCFDGLQPREREELLAKFRERFCSDLNKEETIAFALDLIKQATTSSGTRQYDL
eukprot:CAMPEP_0172473808 /NCGR_PEP_ID=MMETSP1065-20121228/69042_1 /TAXON_ID=265537 /ORGANISM="Amphiprora paludosa, Strain CCMP125" /LENGTH=1271 /DNA_ID=CAMNT_0013231985 /DNA_START=165 /DNA_END=3977 /DNA_ORIENTATION=+